MINDERDTPHGDLILVQTSKEISTCDIPEFALEEDREQTQPFNVVKPRRSSNWLYRLYSFFCVIAVAVALIFAAREIIDFAADGNVADKALLGRLLGQGVKDIAEGKSLTEIIMNQSFGDLSIQKNNDNSLPVPDSDGPSTLDKPGASSPKEENTSPPATEPPATEPPAVTTPPNDQSPPSTSPITPVDPPSENALPIITMDLSCVAYGKNYIYNDTSLTISLDALRDAALTDRYTEGTSAPLVLIIHTHATESYMPEGSLYYETDGEIARSTDENENMIAVGVEFARVLRENGIPTLHCTILHDAESYRDSYRRSAETIAKYLKDYPSIQYVFDLHRDSIIKSSGELVRAVSSINGENHAQIMPVVSAGFEGYEENLTLALKLREALNARYANICRPICLRESLYNQNLAPVSILLEIGTSGCSLSEAKAGAALTASVIAELIKSNE